MSPTTMQLERNISIQATLREVYNQKVSWLNSADAYACICHALGLIAGH